MSNIEKFDPSKLMDGVRDRIKATFISLIPDDHWEKLMQAEIDKYFNPTDQYRSSNYDKVSTFSKDCQSVLTEIAKSKITIYLIEHEQAVWSGSIHKADGKFVELIKEHATEIFAATFSSMFQQAVSRMRSM